MIGLKFRALGTVSIIVLVTVSGCSRDASPRSRRKVRPRRRRPASVPSLPPPGYSPLDPGKLLRSLKAAPSDQDRWNVLVHTVRRLRPTMASRTEEEIAVLNRDALVGATPISEILLEAFPGVAKRLPLRPVDLETLGRYIASKDYARAGVDGWNGVAITWFTSRTRGEMAAAWLLKLTGKRFKDKAAFDNWFRETKPKLRWDPSLGQFRESQSEEDGKGNPETRGQPPILDRPQGKMPE